MRALVVADGDRIRLFSRNGNDVTVAYPELTDRSCWPEQDFIADGEIIAVGPSGRPDFGLLQGRMKLTRPSDVARARQSIPVRLMLFDLLSEGGKDLRRLPLAERRGRLDEVGAERAAATFELQHQFLGAGMIAPQAARHFQQEPDLVVPPADVLEPSAGDTTKARRTGFLTCPAGP